MSQKKTLTHYDDQGRVRMVEVTDKQETVREAKAHGHISLSREALSLIKSRGMKKGDPLEVARIAGIMAAKRTHEIIPLCHPLLLTKIAVELQLTQSGVEISSQVRCTGRTGVEMEALTAVSTAALTIYDMCKAVDKSMEIGAIYLEEKSGGRSGAYRRQTREAGS